MINYFINKIGFIGIGWIVAIFVEWFSDIFCFWRNKDNYRKIDIEEFEEGMYIFDYGSAEGSEGFGDFCGGFDCGGIDF